MPPKGWAVSVHLRGDGVARSRADGAPVRARWLNLMQEKCQPRPGAGLKERAASRRSAQARQSPARETRQSVGEEVEVGRTGWFKRSSGDGGGGGGVAGRPCVLRKQRKQRATSVPVRHYRKRASALDKGGRCQEERIWRARLAQHWAGTRSRAAQQRQEQQEQQERGQAGSPRRH